MKTNKQALNILFFVLVLVLSSTKLFAQGDKSLVNNTPYQVIYNHLYYLQPETYDEKQSAISFPGDNQQKNIESAIDLKEILDGKGLYVDVNLVPDENSYIDSSGNKVYTLFKSEPNIYLEKINGKWYYSRTTIELIPKMHKELYPLGTNVLKKYLGPTWDKKVLGLELNQYLGLLILLVIGIFCFYLLYWLLRYIIRKISYSRVGKEISEIKNTAKAAWALSIFLVSKLMIFFLPTLQLNVKHAFYLIRGLKIFGAVCLLIFLWRVVDLVMKYFVLLAERTTNKMDNQLMPVLRRFLKGVLIIAGIIYVLNLLEVNLTAVLAGISIGGLALALAAQDTVKNLIGSFMIFIDRPFQIGDWISFDDVDGTVEEVGVRSTRIRTFANSITSVPNGKLADFTINNMGVRLYRRYKTDIGITYDTPPYIIEAFVEGIRGLIQNHPYSRSEVFEVHLNSFGANSLNIMIYMFFKVPTWTAELEGKHDLIIGILKLAEELNVRFAFPTSSIHIETIPGQESLTPKYSDSPEMIKEKVRIFMDNYTTQVRDSRSTDLIGE